MPLIRRQSLWERVSSYPHDLLISLNEWYELLEWDSVSNTLSIPLGIGLNGLYLIARRDRQQQARSYDEKDVFEGSRLSRSRDGGGIFTGAAGGLHTLVQPLPHVLFGGGCNGLLTFSCTWFHGVWLDLALSMHCCALQKGRTIEYLMRSLMYPFSCTFGEADEFEDGACDAWCKTCDD